MMLQKKSNEQQPNPIFTEYNIKQFYQICALTQTIY